MLFFTLTRRPAARRGAMAVLIAGALAAGCTPHFERPDVAVVGVERQGGSLREQHFLVHLRVTNPNAQSIPIEGVSYAVSIGGDEVARGETTQAVTVPARGSAAVDLPLTTNLSTGLGTLLGVLAGGGDRLEYRVVGTAHTGITFFRTIPFDQRGSVQLPVGR